jgi:NADPH-dependent 2,4-dienoyl-CoA reductase/sulfur reductase-like enzyme
MGRYDLVVAGGGLTAAKAVEAYREAGGDGTVVVVAGEPHPPYHRPPLSKRLLRGEQEPEQAFVHPEPWYAEHAIELRLGTAVRSLDLGRRVLATDGGDVEFERLLVATGALPRRREGALSLRTIDGSDDFSSYLRSLYLAQGVHLVDDEPEDGDEVVVAGVGVLPAVGWLDGSGLQVDDGVVVDERFRTSADGVWAAGDVARFYDPVFGHHRRIEHWSNAAYQGVEVGKVLAGVDGGYDTVSSFFTELFGNGYRVFGELRGATELEGSFESGHAIIRFRDGGRLVGAVTTGLEDDEQDELKTAIRAGASG